MQFPEQWGQLQRASNATAPRPNAKRRRVRGGGGATLQGTHTNLSSKNELVTSKATPDDSTCPQRNGGENDRCTNRNTCGKQSSFGLHEESATLMPEDTEALEHGDVCKMPTNALNANECTNPVALLFPAEARSAAVLRQFELSRASGLSGRKPGPTLQKGAQQIAEEKAQEEGCNDNAFDVQVEPYMTVLNVHSDLDGGEDATKPLPLQRAVMELQLHTLISRLPFREMLAQMTLDSSSQAPEIPIVTRAWEQSWMREVVYDGELPCASGPNCECMFIDPMQTFVGVQFQLHAGAPSPKLCILCARRVTQELFYEMVYGNPGHEMGGAIQAYGNICGPGEYAREAMLLCPRSGQLHNMPLPIVAHHRHRYSVVVQHNVRRLQQHGVFYEDFH